MFSCFYYVKYTGDKMSIQNMHSLSAGHKAKLRKQLIVGARNYNKYLANKIFKIASLALLMLGILIQIRNTTGIH